jgi:glutamine synthetase
MALQADPRRLQSPLDWNGSGMHANFSTKFMREVGGKDYFEKLMAAFDKHMDEHIAVYGPDNHLRLTGLHETQSIDKFTYGIADRGASDPRPAQLHQQRLQGLPRGSPSELAADPTWSPAGS